MISRQWESLLVDVNPGLRLGTLLKCCYERVNSTGLPSYALNYLGRSRNTLRA